VRICLAEKVTLMTIMVAGGLTFAIPGVMPEAMAANANLFVQF
jgi:hypothetical protein